MAGLITDNFRESPRKAGFYDTAFWSTYSLELEPQVWKEVVDRYDIGLSLTTFSKMAGRTMPVSSKSITIFEKGAPTRPVTATIALDAAPVSNTTVTLDVADGSNTYMRAGFTLIIPASYTNKSLPQEMVITGSASSWKGYFKDVTAAITTALDAVPVAVGASAYAYGTQQPASMTTGTYSRTTNEQIIKSTIGIEGGALSEQQYEVLRLKDGGRGLWTRSIAELDFDMDNQEDSMLLVGQPVTNTITQTSITGDAKTITSATGLLQIMDTLAQELVWDINGFDVDKFRELRPLLENVGVVNKNVDILGGPDLVSDIETNMIDFLATNAGGTEYWDKIGSVGFNFRKFLIDSVNVNLATLHGFANPNKYGLSSYTFKKEGFVFTQGQYAATIDNGMSEEKVRLPHLTLGYRNFNGENRQRIFQMQPGVHGVQGLPNVATMSYDGYYMYCLSHVMPIWNHMYKTIKINYDADEGVGA